MRTTLFVVAIGLSLSTAALAAGPAVSAAWQFTQRLACCDRPRRGHALEIP